MNTPPLGPRLEPVASRDSAFFWQGLREELRCRLSPADVDGVTTFTLDSSEDVNLVCALGIENLRFSSRVPHGEPQRD